MFRETADKTPKKVLLKWTVHPFREHRARGWAVLVFLFLLMGGLYQSTGELTLVAVGTFFFAFTLASFYFPTRYYLCDDEVIIRGLFTQRKKWETFLRWEERSQGILLSPFPHPTYRDSSRGFLLSYRGVDREELVALVKSSMDDAEEKRSRERDTATVAVGSGAADGGEE